MPSAPVGPFATPRNVDANRMGGFGAQMAKFGEGPRRSRPALPQLAENNPFMNLLQQRQGEAAPTGDDKEDNELRCVPKVMHVS